jgi:deoxyribose-phosphate aldolase
MNGERTKELSRERLAKHIDHTLLRPEASEQEVSKLCQEAADFGFYSVCVNPLYVTKAVELLKGRKVKVGTVVGFPLGANTPEVKSFEANDAILRGAEELDMVMNLGALKSGDLALVGEDVEGVVDSARRKSVVVKVIIETGLLNEEEMRIACRLCERAGADFVKSCTGWGPRGVIVEDIKLMRSFVGSEMKIKASGGVRTASQAISFIEAGADRIGTSASVKIMEEFKSGY